MLCDSSKAAHYAESTTAKHPLDQDHDERLTQNILISDSLHQAYIFSENLAYN